MPVHLPNGFFARDSGVEYTLLLAVACVALMIMGLGEGVRAAPDTAEESYRPKASS